MAARHAIVQLSKTNDELSITVEDDGKGFDINSAKKESLGLRNMEHRVQLLGGTIQWQSHKGSGTSILIKIPVADNDTNFSKVLNF